MNNKRVFALLFFGLFLTTFVHGQTKVGAPLSKAHAHNDYLHQKPLFDALEKGFCSIEIDVHLFKGELVVAHVKPLIFNRKHTIEKLYFEPLQKLIENQQGEVFSGSTQRLTLMVDFKTGGKTYAVLLEKLKPFQHLFTRWENGEEISAPLVLNISGARPSAAKLAKEKVRYATLDGRPGDLGGKYGPEIISRISQRYGKLFSWRGKGEIPAEDVLLLQELVVKAEADGRKLRFWATPEKEGVWKWLLDAGVTLISTDKLERLQTFFHENGYH